MALRPDVVSATERAARLLPNELEDLGHRPPSQRNSARAPVFLIDQGEFLEEAVFISFGDGVGVGLVFGQSRR